jgi:hypothetical protein
VGRSALVAAVFVALAVAAPAAAAAPNYILVSGPGLPHPVLLANWDENGAFLSAVVTAPTVGRAVARGLARRPRFRLSEFWGWGGLPRPTRPSQANQHGWFYPARRRQPAVITVTVNWVMVPRLAVPRALAILARHGVPTRL